MHRDRGATSRSTTSPVAHGLVAGVTRQDGDLHGGTVADSLIGVDGLAQLLAVEVVAGKLLHLGDTGGTAAKNELVDVLLGHLRAIQGSLNGAKHAAEAASAQLFRMGTGDYPDEVNALEKGINLDCGLRGRRQSALRSLGAETTKSTSVLLILLR